MSKLDDEISKAEADLRDREAGIGEARAYLDGLRKAASLQRIEDDGERERGQEPRFEAAAQIEALYKGKDLPMTVSELDPSLVGNFKARALRAGFNIVAKARRELNQAAE